MKVIFTIFFMLLVIDEIASNCDNDCCTISTNCCRTNINCCRTNRNCCQTSDDCCKTSNNCCHRNKCSQSTNNTNQPQTSSHGTDKTTPYVIISTPSPAKIDDNRKTSVVNNSNSHNVTTTLNINNNITQENHIHVPITITNDNHQNLQIISWLRPYPAPEPTSDIPTTSDISTTSDNPNRNVTSTSPCSPVPILIPIPQPQEPKSVLPIPGCCMMVSPCVYGNEQCIPYRRICGEQCTYTYMYRPVNPCPQVGCNKRSYGMWNYCYYGGCQNRLVDCGYCQDDFYISYRGYIQCGGCYYI